MGRMGRILNPHTRQPASMEEQLDNMVGMRDVLSAQALRSAEESAKAQAVEEKEQEQREAARNPINDARQLASRFDVMSGRLLIRKRRVSRRVSNATDVDLAATDDRVEMMNQFEPWGTVLLVGDGFFDYGRRIDPHPGWVAGARVLFNPAGGTDIDLPVPGTEETMTLTLVGFRGVLMVDRGETAAVVSTDAAAAGDETANEGAAV